MNSNDRYPRGLLIANTIVLSLLGCFLLCGFPDHVYAAAVSSSLYDITLFYPKEEWLQEFDEIVSRVLTVQKWTRQAMAFVLLVLAISNAVFLFRRNRTNPDKPEKTSPLP